MRLGLVVVTLLALLGYTAVALKSYFEVEEVRLPSVVGLPRAEAEALLRSIKLEPLTFSEAVSGAPLGAVTSQTPGPGTIVREGRSVSLGVNEAAAGVAVPSVVGASRTEAAERLAAAGLELGEVTFRFDDAEEGRVVGQSLAEGETVAASTRVDLVVSRGPEVETVTLPRLRGLNIDAAKNRLRSLGFSNVVTTATGVSFDRPFTVTDQLPTAGQEAPLNAQIVLQYTLSTATVAQVPTLDGLSLSRAQLLLDASGLALGPVSYISDPAQPGGVVSYEPTGYTLTGSPVGLTLNRAGTPRTDLPTPFSQEEVASLSPDFTDLTPTSTSEFDSTEAVDSSPPAAVTPAPGAAGSRTIPFTFDPAQQGLNLNSRDYKLTLKVADDQGERVVYEGVVQPNEIVRTDVTVYGEALLQTYLNDILFQAWNP